MEFVCFVCLDWGRIIFVNNLSKNILKYLSSLKLSPSEFLLPSAGLLIIANLVPIYGVFFLDWNVFPILLLFWMENVLMGLFNVVKMLMVNPSSAGAWGAKLLIIPFFFFHYGMFTLAHGIFVFALFGGYFNELEGFPTADSLVQVISDFQLDWAILALFLSHAISFVLNYVGRGEYKKAKLKELMTQPYGRVVILHITIIIGAFLVMLTNAPIFVLVILLLLKIFIDISTHAREHRKYAIRSPGDTGETHVYPTRI